MKYVEINDMLINLDRATCISKGDGFYQDEARLSIWYGKELSVLSFDTVEERDYAYGKLRKLVGAENV